MTDLDLTEAVEAAAKAEYDETFTSMPEWDDVDAMCRHAWRDAVLVAVTAAAPIIAAQTRESVIADAIACGPDPEWDECTEHPGRENHCASGYCGACWSCRESGITRDHAEAYAAGMRSAERRIAARIAGEGK